MTIGSQRAYFQLLGNLTAGNAGSLARILLNFTDEASGIVSTKADDAARAPHGPWYTLDGRQMENGKWPRGIYVGNGRKVVIK